MKIKRFKSISFFGSSVVDYEIPKSRFGPSVADTTYFIPTSEAVRALKAGDVPSNLYDFADGKDTGLEFSFARDRRSDLAQISTDLRKRNQELSKAVSDAVEVAELKRKVANKFEKKVSDVSVSSSASSASSASSSDK